MAKLFDKVRLTKPKLNKFDLSHERKFSCNMGSLIPIMITDVVPGDNFRVNSEIMMRLAPMLAPIMHRVNVFTHYFFVPNRLVWDEWEDFITGGRLGTSSPVAPQLNVGHDEYQIYGAKGMLPDYFGIPTYEGGAASTNYNVSALPFRAYQLIYNEYYRDQNLTEPIVVDKSSGLSPLTDVAYAALLTLRKRAWEKDYFTSALPFAQRGGEVSVPVDGEVTYKDVSEVIDSFTGLPAATGDILNDSGDMKVGAADSRLENIESLSSVSVTINLLRRAVKLQEWLEKNARGGARYVEQVLSHFGVVSSDARLQRPEYLGGGKNPVVISEVLSTFQADGGEIPQGSMAGHGISVGNTNGFRRRFEEHGYIIGIMSVLPRTTYQQGVPRHLRRFDKFDYFWPEFAHLGEQEVMNREVYQDMFSADPNVGVFGYQSRYCDYKYMQDSVHGDMRDELAYWHMSRIFGSAPALNQEFIEADPTHRIFAVTDPAIHKLYVQLYNHVDALRPMPYFGTPSL